MNAGQPPLRPDGGVFARRGDLVVIHVNVRSYDSRDGEPEYRDEYRVGQVTSASADAPAALAALHGQALADGWDTQVAFRPSPAGGGTWALSAANPAVEGAFFTAAWENEKRAATLPGGGRATPASLSQLRDMITAAPRSAGGTAEPGGDQAEGR